MRALVRGARAIGRVLWRSKQLDADMQEEMRFHVQMEAERLTRIEGLHPGEARRQARAHLPGAQAHHHLLWRYSVRWQRGVDGGVPS